LNGAAESQSSQLRTQQRRRCRWPAPFSANDNVQIYLCENTFKNGAKAQAKSKESAFLLDVNWIRSRVSINFLHLLSARSSQS
jgi:hypothetical protein